MAHQEKDCDEEQSEPETEDGAQQKILVYLIHSYSVPDACHDGPISHMATR